MGRLKNIAALKSWLRRHGIDASGWGRGESKSVRDLWTELRRGESSLRERPALRVVSVVRVIVRRRGKILCEVGQELGNGHFRKRMIPPSEKLLPAEDFAAAARRCLAEELGLKIRLEDVLRRTHRVRRSIGSSQSYPNLATHFTVHSVALRLKSSRLPDRDFSTNELPGKKGDPVRRHWWTWRKPR